MKHLALTTIMTLVSSLALAAGGTGGGGWRPGPMAMTNKQNLDLSSFVGATSGNSGGGDRPREIVYNMGQKNGLVRFAYGQFVDQKWQIQKIEITEAELLNDNSTIKALEVSKSLNNWAELN